MRKGKITAKFQNLKRVLIEDAKEFMSPEKFEKRWAYFGCHTFTSTQRRGSKSSNFLVSYIKNKLKD